MKKKSMKKINLSALTLECLGGKTEIANVRDVISNLLFNGATRIPEKRLAEKLYDAKDEVELNEEESSILVAFANREDLGLILRLKEAIIKPLE